MSDPALAKIAHARALMLGSSQFPPREHLAYLEQAGPRAGTGFSPVTLGDLTLREVDPVAERTEIVRVVAETLLAFGQVGRMLAPASVNSVPGGLVAAELVWYGLEHEGVLVGLHGGFCWSPALWVRRFYAVLDDDTLAPPHGTIEALIYGHLWGLGMRAAMIQIPAGTANLEARRASGWTDSHEVRFQHNARPFMWLRKVFPVQPRWTLAGGRLSAGPAWEHVT